MRESAYTFMKSYTTSGGKCTVYDLPSEGINVNVHKKFQDLNNDVIAAHIEEWINNNIPNEKSSSLGRYLNIRKLISFLSFFIF